MFVDREQELAFLTRIAERQRPGPAQLVLLYGRRRVGKTALLHQWTRQSGISTTYWTAEKEPAALQRRKLYAALAGLPIHQAPTFETWAEVWDAAATMLAGKRHILVLDELPYAMESDPATLSALQHAWDRSFQHYGLHRDPVWLAGTGYGADPGPPIAALWPSDRSVASAITALLWSPSVLPRLVC